MKSVTAMQRGVNGRDRAPAVTKAGLALIFALGLVMIAAGWLGMNAYNASGFSAEAGYGAIYALSGDMDDDWREQLQPLLGELSPNARAALDDIAYGLLTDSWEAGKKGARADADALLDAAGADRSAQIYKLLYATYSVNGPKVTSAIKKEIIAVPLDARRDFRAAVLACLLDPALELPSGAVKAADKLEGDERAAMLMQVFFVSADDACDGLPGEHVNALKKSVRDKAVQLTAFAMIVNRDVSWIQQIIISHSRTVILIGIMLALDVLLLAMLMAGDKNWVIDVKWIIILLIVDFLLFFQMLPLFYLIVKSFFPNGTFTLETFSRLYTYPLNLDALLNTVIAAFATMVLGTLLAFPLAWLVGRTNLHGKKFFRRLFVLTYMVPPYVGAMAWLRLLNPNVGTINQVFRAVFGLSDAPGPLNIYSLGGLIWVLTTFYYPYAFITISRAMEKMDPSLEEASRISGASPLKTLFTVTLPMMLPSLISGALLVFVCAASCYGIPSIIGAPGKVHTVTTRIVEYVTLGSQGINDATGMAVFLMIIAAIILYISDFVLAKRQYITVSGKSVRPAIVDLRKWRVPLTVVVSLFAVVVILIPFATILTTSFKIDVGKSVFDPENFTFGQWTLIFGRPETINSLKNSLIFGAVTATVGILVACVMSYLLQRTRVRGRKLPDFLITLGSGTPSVVIALGLIMTMKGTFGVSIYNTAYIIIVAYLIKYMMMGMRTVVSAMSQIHVSLEECSQVSGASWLRTMFRITGPLIFPSIAAGWFLIFIPSFYELSMTTLLYSSTTKTIGFQLYEYWTFTSQPQSCAMAFGILMIVVALNAVLNRLTKGEFSI